MWFLIAAGLVVALATGAAVFFRSKPHLGGVPENRTLYDEDPFIRLDVDGAARGNFDSGLTSAKGGGARHLIVKQHWSEVSFDAFLKAVADARSADVKFRGLESSDRVVSLYGEKLVDGEPSAVEMLYSKTSGRLGLTLTNQYPTFMNLESSTDAHDPEVVIAAGLSGS